MTLPAKPRPTWVDPTLWPYEGRLHAVPGGRLHVTEVGQGPPVVFVHGTPSWSIDWRHLVRGWEGTRRITVDHLGFGQSDRPSGAGYTPEDHTRRFSALADALDLHDVTVVVHDFGGPIALPWVLDHPERVRRLVILNTWAWPFTDPTTRFGARVLGSAFGRFLYRWLNLSLRVIGPSAWGDRSKLTPALQAQLLAPFQDRGARVEVLWVLARALLTSEPHYAALEGRLAILRNLPVDLVWGMKDHAFTPRDLERWMHALPHARVLRLPEAGHWPHEEAPDEVLAFLRAG